MNVDHFFTIGSAHNAEGTPCEDYALSGELQSGAVFGVVADGCSGAAAHTDVGARAIAWAFKQAADQRVVQPGNWFGLGFHELLSEAFLRHQFDGVPEDYLATLVGFVATPEAASVLVHGDGAVALRYADGRMRLIQFSWWDNTPFYLNYHVHSKWLDEFLMPYQAGVLEPFAERNTLFSKTADNLQVDETDYRRYPVGEMLQGHVLNFRPADEGIVALAVFTDGLEQFAVPPAAQSLSKYEPLMPPTQVAAEALAYKNHEGAFVKRRMLRALKDYRKAEIIPRDDFGIAAVWFGGGN